MYRKIFSVKLTVLAACALFAFSAACASASPNESILATNVALYQVENVTMEGALRSLRATNFNQILIGFEKVARHRDEKESTLSLLIANSTVGEILGLLTKQDTRYTYESIDGLLVHVYPVSGQSDPPGLLDLRIKEFSVQADMTPAAVITRIGELAPELACYLTDKQNEYYARRGIVPSAPGAIMHGNMDPHIDLHVQNGSIREILNATVLYSLRLNNQAPPDWTGNKIPPTSWMYEFVIDSTWPTGLGGYPRWVAF